MVREGLIRALRGYRLGRGCRRGQALHIGDLVGLSEAIGAGLGRQIDPLASLAQLGIRSKPAPEAVWRSGDRWSIRPYCRPTDFGPIGAILPPSGLALILERGGVSLPLEIGALTFAEMLAGEWSDLGRMAEYMARHMDEAERKVLADAQS